MKDASWLTSLAILLFFGLADLGCQVSAAECRYDAPVRIAGLEYDSGAFGAALVSELVTRGFGCASILQKGGTLELVKSLINGHLDVITELWEANSPAGWIEAETARKVVKLGRGYLPTQQGWFVPRYMVEGHSALAPQLRSVSDLPALKQMFSVPGEPGRGRFYNCALGTECEIINTKKLRAYGLEREFTNYLPSSQASVESAIKFALRKREAILFYYWQPSALLAKGESVQLKEPEFEPVIWSSLLSETNPRRGCSYPLTSVVIAGNASFVSRFPEIGAMLRKMDLGRDEILNAELLMRKESLPPKAAALRFLREHKEVWALWVSPVVADKISGSLQKKKIRRVRR